MIPYWSSDSVLVRCDNVDCTHKTIYIGHFFEVEKYLDCPYCQKPRSKFMADGTWQSQAERDQLNQIAYQRMAE